MKNQSDNRVNEEIRKIRKKNIVKHTHTATRTARVSEWNKKYTTATTIIIICVLLLFNYKPI